MKMKRLVRGFLDLGIIVGPLPSQLVDGNVADAIDVMADLNFIAAQVNANAQPVAASSTLIPQYVAAVAGTPNAITLTPTVPISAYSAGQSYMFLPIAPNTGATSINVSGLGARNLLYADGTAMTGGELLAGQPYLVQDNGAAYVLVNSAQATGIVPWVPTIAFGGASVGVTYATQTGVACKIGRICFFAFVVALTNKGASVGVASVGGLPYTVNAGWIGNNGGPVAAANLGFAGGYNVFGYNLGTKTMSLLNITNLGVIAGFTDVSFTNTTLLAGSAFYAV
jgi:hypothetical protein